MSLVNMLPITSSYSWGLIIIFECWQSGVIKAVILSIIFFAWRAHIDHCHRSNPSEWEDHFIKILYLSLKWHFKDTPPLPFCLAGPHRGEWCWGLENLYLGGQAPLNFWMLEAHRGRHWRIFVLFHLPVNVDPWTLLKPNHWPDIVWSRTIHKIYLNFNYSLIC